MPISFLHLQGTRIPKLAQLKKLKDEHAKLESGIHRRRVTIMREQERRASLTTEYLEHGIDGAKEVYEENIAELVLHDKKKRVAHEERTRSRQALGAYLLWQRWIQRRLIWPNWSRLSVRTTRIWPE